jgi:hypothetical protein
MTDAPTGSNADEWALFLSEWGTAYCAVQIAEAIEAAEQRGFAAGIEAAKKEYRRLQTGLPVGASDGQTFTIRHVSADELDEALCALTPSAPAPVVPKVKPLVWEDGKFKHRNGATYTKRGYSSHGPYYANEDGWCGPGVAIDYVSAGTDVVDYVNQIHEARILSQIDMAPVTVPEAARVILKDTDALTDLSILTMREHKRTLNTGKGGYIPALKHALRAIAEQEGK